MNVSTPHLSRGPLGTLNERYGDVVYRDGYTVRTETFDGKPLGSFRLSETCSVRLIGQNKLFVSNCKGPRVVDYNGIERVRFRYFKGSGFFPSDWSANGERLLFDHFSRKISVLRATGEVLVAFASFGMGVGDEADNRERVQVLDINTGESCFDLRRSFADNSGSSSENAFISPSGQYVAIVAGTRLSIYDLPATCRPRK